MNATPWIIMSVVLIVVIYFVSKTQMQSKTVADATVAALAAPVEPPTVIINNCVPFTQSMQNKEKLAKIVKERCDMKALIPIVGPKQYYDCMKKVNESLTPINNCQ